MRRFAFIFLVLAFVGFASAHELNTLYAPGVGARAMGMGGAFVAMSGDPACLFWNPAGCAWMDKPTVYLEGTYEERWKKTTPNDYWYAPWSGVKPTSYSSHYAAPKALILLTPLPWGILGFGLSVPYETRLKDGNLIFRGRNSETKAVGNVRRTSIVFAAGEEVLGKVRASLGFNLHYDRFRFERGDFCQDTSSGAYGPSVSVRMDRTLFENQGFNFDLGALVETKNGIALGAKVGVVSGWDGEGTDERYYYYSYYDTVNHITVQESFSVNPFESSVNAPQYAAFGMRIQKKILSIEGEVTFFRKEQVRYLFDDLWWRDAYQPWLFSGWTLPTSRVGLEVQPFKGIFLRAGAYGYSKTGYYNRRYGDEEHEPSAYTAGLGLERHGIRADFAVERQSAGDREKSTRATLGLTYALGK
jgi:hypothetical protein